MTFVINQGMAMYWGTSRWSAMEIMVSPDFTIQKGSLFTNVMPSHDGINADR